MKLILHIGTEKTGTTVIQNWLYQNESVLREHGFLLTHAMGAPNNRRLGAYFQQQFDDFFLDHNIANEAARDAFFADFEANVDAELAAARDDESGACHTCIVSSEHLSSRLTTASEVSALAAFLRARFAEIEVICYFRDQDSLRRSLYSTALISGYNAAPEEFMADVGDGHYYFNYNSICSNWSDHFSPDRLTPVIYRREAFPGGDVRRDFAQRLALPVDAMSFLEAAANESLSAVQMYLLRLINSVRGRYLEDGRLDREREALVSAIVDNAQLAAGGKYRGNSVQISPRFADANQQFGQKFLGLSGSPFTEDSAKGPASHAADGDVLDAAAEVLSALDEALPLLVTLFHADAGKAEDSRVVGVLRLSGAQIDTLRDVALQAERGEVASLDQAVILMQMARAGRPDGPVIRDFLQRHERPAEITSDEMAAAGQGEPASAMDSAENSDTTADVSHVAVSRD